MKSIVNVGLDVGSTTVKIVVLDENKEIVFKDYRRHFSDIKKTVIDLLSDMQEVFSNFTLKLMITGSAGLGLAEELGAGFIQEVSACTKAIRRYAPETDVAIELGGEDAKIMYFGHSVEQRMNGTCAGGTGAFIDQMSSLLKTDASGLNTLASTHRNIYPIASRCGVFAKTDVQPLINEGAAKEDIAASVLQAVVNQTIGGLACGKPIRGKVAFLGGPLTFMPELKTRFKETLKLEEQDEIKLTHTEYFVALGAALSSESCGDIEFKCLYEKMPSVYCEVKDSKEALKPLFESEADYEAFKARHDKNAVKSAPIETASGPLYIGIDAGSTTTKLVAINASNEVVFSHYQSNEGNPLESVIKGLKRFYSACPKDAYVASSAVTGYGEYLLKAALDVDFGEIETVAHSKAADFFLKGVDFILDIGGQDMKCLHLKDGILESIMLNEACSSGCGSFVETFAKAMGMDVADFAKVGLFSKKPVDLGTRCTVFMNSRVKQAQKEGATVADISAGIAVSVIKNALFKVIRMRSKDDLGGKIVVQGGTFHNDAVLRAFERISEREVVRPNIAGLMGAFGCALIAKERRTESHTSTLLDLEALDNFSVKLSTARCRRCSNLCHLTINQFSDGKRYITGNRCEKGLGIDTLDHDIPNLYAFKNDTVFKIQTVESPRGRVGIPRVLNLYEDFPFWEAFFRTLNYQVVLSAHSTKQIYEMGIESIPSESVCYPAKLVHGHIEDLIAKEVDHIFYPSIPYNLKEDQNADNHYNCPVVTSYPETINANVETFKMVDTHYHHPFFPLDSAPHMKKRAAAYFKAWGLDKKSVDAAVEAGYEALSTYKAAIRREGERALEYMKMHQKKGIVLSGRPYHVDPEINHGIPELIQSFGFVVLSEDAIAHLKPVRRPLNAVDQWMYHTRLYNAAAYVAESKDLELIQLTSFGCGLDAVTADEVQSILKEHHKLYTLIKIDEINNLGAVRIRVRSLIAAIEQRERQRRVYDIYEMPKKVLFTKEMRKTHTILVPQMSPIHFQFLEPAMRREGYNIKVLPSIDKKAVDEGLKYVNNDACYPSILVVGQMMKAINSGEYDLDKTALIITQTGGGCRATNYIAFIRKALSDSGIKQVPVISLSAQGLESHPGFEVKLPMLERLIQAMIYGDLFMRVLYKTRPYEAEPGASNALYERWTEKCKHDIEFEGRRAFKNNVKQIVEDFDTLPLKAVKKPKVGLVGEILVKFHPTANNNIVDVIEGEGGEAVMPDLLDFFSYCAYNAIVKHKELSGSFKNRITSEVLIKLLEQYRSPMTKALAKSKRFEAPKPIHDLGDLAKEHLSLCNQTGEGWFLTAEMVELMHSGVDNIVCMQPFACLPNHITGKGMIKSLKKTHPKSNIVAIDYDPGASEVNQLNRIKLMLNTAFENLE